jgi:hypothetical protein
MTAAGRRATGGGITGLAAPLARHASSPGWIWIARFLLAPLARHASSPG